jgi:hypothetical protein
MSWGTRGYVDFKQWGKNGPKKNMAVRILQKPLQMTLI